MIARETATILIVPGLREHVASHWQTHLEARLFTVLKVVSNVGTVGHVNRASGFGVWSQSEEFIQFGVPVDDVLGTGRVAMSQHCRVNLHTSDSQFVTFDSPW